MSTKGLLIEITEELKKTFGELSQNQLDNLEEGIISAERIFVAGAGRSLLMVRGLAMRLMQAGFSVYVAGETVTPAIGRGDLLIIASGSGETGTLRVIAGKGKKAGAKLAVITTKEKSSIASLADYVLIISAATTKDTENQIETMQMGAGTFEQSVLIIGDALVLKLSQGISFSERNRLLMERHANLE